MPDLRKKHSLEPTLNTKDKELSFPYAPMRRNVSQLEILSSPDGAADCGFSGTAVFPVLKVT